MISTIISIMLSVSTPSISQPALHTKTTFYYIPATNKRK